MSHASPRAAAPVKLRGSDARQAALFLPQRSRRAGLRRCGPARFGRWRLRAVFAHGATDLPARPQGGSSRSLRPRPARRALLAHYGLDADDPATWLYLEDGRAYAALDGGRAGGPRLGGFGWLVAPLRFAPDALGDRLYASSRPTEFAGSVARSSAPCPTPNCAAACWPECASAEPAQALARERVLRIDFHRPIVGFDRLGAVALLLVGDAEIGPTVGVAVVDVERGVEILDRRIVLAAGDEALAARLDRARRRRGCGRWRC